MRASTLNKVTIPRLSPRRPMHPRHWHENGGTLLRVAIIASMKSGLEHFIWREISYLEESGAEISLFPTKYKAGLYGPKPEWSFYPYKLLWLLASQPVRFIQSPLLYCHTVLESMQLGALSECLLAWYFTSKMRNVDVLYSTFGDRKLYVAYFCKRILNLPLVTTVHAYELYDNPNPRLFPKALGACDRVITISEHNRQLLAKPENGSVKSEIVRLSVDLHDYRPQNKFTVLIVGSLLKGKVTRCCSEQSGNSTAMMSRYGLSGIEVSRARA